MDRLVLGCAALCNAYPPASLYLGASKSVDLLNHARDRGIHLYETSKAYGEDNNRIVEDFCFETNMGLIMKYVDYDGGDPPRGTINLSHNWVDVSDRSDGASVYTVDEVRKLAVDSDHQIIEVPYNLLNQSVYIRARSYGFDMILIRSILLRGKLACMAEDAIRWAYHTSGDAKVIIGCRTKQEIDSTLEAIAKGPISWDEIIDPRRW